jgi:hypothetical protein
MNPYCFALAVQTSPSPAPGDIRGIKPPVPIPQYGFWIGCILAALVLGALSYWLWRWHRRKQPTRVKPAEVIPPHVRGRQRLQAALSLMTEPRLFVISVSDTVRLYLEERFDLRAPERTTEEFLRELAASRVLTEDQKESLADFLQRCDLVKFARYEPALVELQEIHDVALRLVEETIPPPPSTELGHALTKDVPQASEMSNVQ